MIIRKDNLIIIWLCVLSSVMGYEEQKFAMEPQDQTAVVGSRVTLPCRVTGKSGILQWTKDDFGLGTHRNLSGFDRYTMIGSDEEGDFSLDIYPVMLDDDARYQCQVSPGPLGQPGIRSKFATLTVYVPPDPPRIVQGKHLITTEDREIELECISYGGKPAAEITWIDGHGNVLTDGIEYIVEELSDGRRFTAKSILKLTPKKEHHNTTFTCQAQNTAERTHRSAKLSLEVKYAPKVTVSIVSETSSNGRILEGSDVRLKCNADANPPDLTYRWFLNDELVVGDYTTELLLHNVTRKYHDSMVKCEVHNPVGKSEESETLDISYAPYFRNKPKSVQADLGSTKTITCDVDGNPLPEITWIKEDTNEVVSNNPNLTVKVERKTAGRYLCKAHIPGFPDVEASAAIYLKGPPNIISRRTQFGIEGDNVRVECTAYSVPAADHVIWTFNGKEVDVHDQDFSILEDPIPEGIKSTLIIRESQGRHFGNYNCTVSNAYGTDVVEINLIPQKNFPILIVIVGVVGAIIVLVIVVMIVFLCQRQGNKKSQPDGENNTMEKQCKESDRSSNISDLKIDLRTGSSVSNVHCDDYVPGIESETGSESVITRIGVPLAGPVAISNQDIYRYSADYTDANFASKDGQNNNGYVPYVDYARDYNPPMPQPPPMESSESLQSRALQLNAMQAPHYTISSTITLNDLNSSSIPNGHTTMGGSIDPRYSAAYGNPYLRSSSVGLPTPNTANPVATPAPPPYSRDTSSTSRTLVNCSNAAMNICAGSAAANGVAVTAATPQLTRLPNSPTNHQYITTTKRGALATHV
ncbi:irregular chiasm C-roughest protein isoform X2 [Agrilus planipennis]|uniref:Irregular chiasm C-roughest protein isoform X2 n=1 Tax=Agrilus planipennis TaxID=224129 RepID=A0A1W4WYV5_AGRPL|nr:irregular chiasm C-roughest protein isoform X2 [Agrilus planipennis]